MTFLDRLGTGVLWWLWWPCNGAMFGAINSKCMVSGMAVSVALVLDYVTVRLRAVDMTVLKI